MIQKLTLRAQLQAKRKLVSFFANEWNFMKIDVKMSQSNCILDRGKLTCAGVKMLGGIEAGVIGDRLAAICHDDHRAFPE